MFIIYYFSFSPTAAAAPYYQAPNIPQDVQQDRPIGYGAFGVVWWVSLFNIVLICIARNMHSQIRLDCCCNSQYFFHFIRSMLFVMRAKSPKSSKVEGSKRVETSSIVSYFFTSLSTVKTAIRTGINMVSSRRRRRRCCICLVTTTRVQWAFAALCVYGLQGNKFSLCCMFHSRYVLLSSLSKAFFSSPTQEMKSTTAQHTQRVFFHPKPSILSCDEFQCWSFCWMPCGVKNRH